MSIFTLAGVANCCTERDFAGPDEDMGDSDTLKENLDGFKKKYGKDNILRKKPACKRPAKPWMDFLIYLVFGAG